MVSEQIYDMDVISSYLEEANEYGLLSEVVFFALKAMKDDPTLSEAEAISIGYTEWVK